jgi:dTDP-4-amino-4,6-dideoxygalactose transaminase
MSLKPYRIWLSPPQLTGEEMGQLQSALNSGWIAPVGPQLTEFEQAVGTASGAKFAMGVSSGTAALHLALVVAGVQAGDVVICPSFSYVATANPILYQKALPVFVDCDVHHMQMSPYWLAIALQDIIRQGKRPAAVIVAHLYGHGADIGAIRELCNQFKVPLIEDAAEAFGATWQGQWLGTFGQTGIYSFNGNKIITCSSGGMLVSQSEGLVDKARALAQHAKDPSRDFYHSTIGYNYQLSNLLAAVGLAQLGHLTEWIAIRRRHYEYYRQRLHPLQQIEWPELIPGISPNHWLTTIAIRPEGPRHRDAILLALEKKGIQARPTWSAIHTLPHFSNRPYYGSGNANRWADTGICLPSGTQLLESDLDEICTIIERVLVA